MPNSNDTTGREIDYAQLVKRAQGKDANKRETAYKFSNNREFKNADEDGCGPYGDAAEPTS
jgi:hypothetical protein